MSKIAMSHAVVLVAERRWRIMRGTRTSVIATPAIIDKCETITEMSVRFVKPYLRLLNMARSLRRARWCPADVMSVLADVQFPGTPDGLVGDHDPAFHQQILDVRGSWDCVFHHQCLR
jgi:hypothetical protein